MLQQAHEGVIPVDHVPGGRHPSPQGGDAFRWRPPGAPRDLPSRIKRILVIENTAPDTGTHHAATWIASEARARRLAVVYPNMVPGDRGLREVPNGHDIGKSDAALVILYRVAPEPEPEAQPASWEVWHPSGQLLVGADEAPPTPWEVWARVTRAMVDMGATAVVVAAGAAPAAIAACARQGASAVVAVDKADRMLDALVHSDWSLAARDGGEASSRPFSDERLQRLARLTTVELRVLYYLVRGYPAGRIAATLQMALSTARAHIRSILRKLDVNSQLAAVALAHGVAAGDTWDPDQPPS